MKEDSTIKLLSRLRSLGVELRVEKDGLRIEAPTGVIDPALRQELSQRKVEIIGFITASASSVGYSKLTLEPISRGQSLPLSFSQERLWFLSQLEPESTAYNVPASLCLRGRLDEEALEHAFVALAHRHENLRTTFRSADGRPILSISHDPKIQFDRIDLRHLWEEEPESEAKRLCDEDVGKVFDLANGPLLRILLLRLRDDVHIIHINMHHIISDQRSFAVMTKELGALYRSFVERKPAHLPELPIQYVDFAHWQRQWLQGEVLNEQLSYWKEKLGGKLPVIQLPADRPRLAVQTHRGGRQSLVLPERLYGALQTLSRREEVTLFMLLLAAFKVLLFRYTGQDDIIVGTPIAGRNRTELEGLIGFFINTIVMRTDLSGNPSFKELLGRVRETALGAYAHQEMPFEKLVEELAPKRDLSNTPLFQIFLNHVVVDEGQAQLPGLTIEMLGDFEAESKFDMTLYIWEQADAIRLTALYNADLFDAERMATMLDQYRELLKQIVDNPEERIAHYSLLTPSQKKNLPDPITPLIPRWAGAVHERFSEQARRVSERMAVVDTGESWSYEELERCSNRLAGHLRAKGIQRGDAVAICGHRSAGLVLSVLGVLKAGGAFLILDSRYPVSRVVKILEEASPRGCLQMEAAGPCADEVQAWLDASQLTCRLTIPGTKKATEYFLEGMSPEPPEDGVGPDDMAYITFTSGTTGRPKGIVGTHRPLAHFLEWHCREFDLKESDRFSMLSGLSHDPLLRDIFAPLWLGATLCIPDPDEMLIPDKLRTWMRIQQITIAHITPALGQLLSHAAEAKAGDEELPALRYVFFGGDTLTQRHVDKIRGIAPSVTCVNYYGATETPQAMGYHVVDTQERDQLRESIPLGKGIEGVQLLVLNPVGQVAGIGELGEIHIRTPYLARCYLNDEELTMDRFIPNPFIDLSGDRLYRTGDLGRYLPDGQVMFYGRSDGQVSIRGFRVELKEIEAILTTHPDIRDCVVIVRERESDDKYLAAYVVGEDARTLDPANLRQHVGKHLPEYMIPSAVIALEELPLTLNGKIDTGALLAPEFETKPDPLWSYEPPRYPTEQSLVEIWSRVLGKSQIGVHDNFFQLGGHSLLVAQIVSRIREVLNVDIPLRSLFENPSIADLATFIDQMTGKAEALRLPRVTPISRDGSIPVSFSQERLWFLNQLEPESTAYSMPGSIRLKGKLDRKPLEQTFMELVRRHETLRTTFRFLDGRPEQVIAAEPETPLIYEDFRNLPADIREAEVLRLADEQSRKPFDLASGPLFRATLYQLDDEDHMMHVNMHHIISDYWSFGIMNREFAELYAAFAAGKPARLPDLAVQYADFAFCQRQWLQGGVLATHLSYWRERLGGEIATLDLPTDRPRLAVQTHRGSQETLIIEQSLVEASRELSRRRGASLFMLLLAAFKVLLFRYTGQDDIIVGTPIAGRNRTELEGLIGFFINTIVMRTDLSGNPSFKELLGRVRETALGAYAHQEMPFEKLVEELAPKRDLSNTPLFQIFFNHIRINENRIELPGLEAEIVGGIERESKFDMTLYIWEQADAIRLTALYNADLFDAERMATMLDQYRELLKQIVDNPEERIAHYSLLTPSQKKNLPDPITPLIPRWAGAVHERFSEQARRVSERMAVVDTGESWSYEELERCSNRLAGHLRAKGIQRGDAVAICGHRSAGLVLSVLGVLKAGGAFLILDSRYPVSRVVKILEEASPRGCLQMEAAGPCADEVQAWLDASQLTCRLTIPGTKKATEYFLEGMSPEPPEDGVGPDDMAYITFTSGTTGRPKGIVGTHRPLAHFLEWHCREFDLKESDRFSMLSGLSHDPLLRDIFAPLWLGATLCIPDPDEMLIPDKLRTWMRIQQITIAHITPALGQLLSHAAEAKAGDEELPALRYVFFGGDTLTQRHVDKIRGIAPSVTCVNYYGATETPQAMGYHVVDTQERDQLRESIPLGKGIEGVQLLVLNPVGQVAGIGELGEIHIRTPYLARCYLNDEELTMDRFIPNPFIDLSGDRLYRTGDLGRYLPDGQVMFYGRSDGQVSIRGFRVELKEIEAILTTHPDIRDCVVITSGEGSDDRYLVAYVVNHDHNDTTSASLREYASRYLPDYMIPSVLIDLDEIPLTPNGKIDLASLPEPRFTTRPDPSRSYQPPRYPTEQLLVEIWASLLKVSKVGIHDNFFELGGHSLLATRVISRVRDHFHLELPLRAIFETLTVAKLAERIQAQLEGTDSAGLALYPITPAVRSGDLPLSYSQERMWFLQQLIPEGTAYNMSGAVIIDGVLDMELLKETFQFLAKHHESLRTTFGSRDGQPFQRIAADPDFLFQIVDLRHLPSADRQSEALRMATKDSRKPFNLDSGPLLRIYIYRISEDKHILHSSMHHIITDLWSSGILGREFLSVYRQLSERGSPQLQENRIDYADFAVWQRNWLTGEVLGHQTAYWKKQLAGLQVLELPTDRPRPAVFSGKGARTAIPVPDELAKQLKSFSADIAVTPFMVLLAAFYTLLWRYTGQEDIAIGVPIANRHRTEIEEVVGTFVNTLVLRINLTDDLSFRHLVLSVRDMALSAYAHQDLPFERLVEELRPSRDPSHSPLVQVMFNLANTPAAEASISGLTFHPLRVDRAGAQFDLTMAIALDSIPPAIVLAYATDLFEPETVQRMLEHYVVLLGSAMQNPNQPISTISFLCEAEAEKMLEEWNQTRKGYPSDQVASRLFEERSIQHPETTAVICGPETISYGELNRRANQLAQYLLDMGVVPDSFVGIFLERTIDMVVSLLGVMKSGAAYLPMDPAFPEDRIAFMLKDSRATVVITQDSLLDQLPESAAHVVCIDTEGEKILQFCGHNPERDPDPESIAYIIYTSGSTGLPKGVQVSHRALVNFLWSMAHEPGLTSNDTILAVTTLSFDIAGLELFLPLIVGGKIALANRDTATDGRLLAEALKTSGATVLQATPASWRMLIEAGWRGDKGLKVLVGGEALPRELAAQLFDRCGELWNMYGPTETTIWSTISRVTNIEEPILIGKPIANTTVYILDKHLRPVPVGVPGELHIGGEGLAKGYLNRDALTREKFIPNPFGSIPGERIYKTGDLARYRPDGRIECIGRLDHQVKMRGYRIELGEIETALADHPGLNKNVVVAREDKPGEKRLVAYIVPDKDTMISPSEIRAHLKRTLPDYMIPSAFVAMDELPLTPNGKINRLALPIPDSGQLEDRREYAAPCSPMEETLVAIWKEVLELDHISVHDNFFEIGGHSLLSMQVISRLEKKIALRINPRELIYQTLGQLAASLELQTRDLTLGKEQENKSGIWQAIKSRLFRLQHKQ